MCICSVFSVPTHNIHLLIKNKFLYPIAKMVAQLHHEPSLRTSHTTHNVFWPTSAAYAHYMHRITHTMLIWRSTQPVVNLNAITCVVLCTYTYNTKGVSFIIHRFCSARLIDLLLDLDISIEKRILTLRLKHSIIV